VEGGAVPNLGTAFAGGREAATAAGLTVEVIGATMVTAP
jgi:hypothetical protein